MAKVLHEVLVDYNFTDKVRTFLDFFTFIYEIHVFLILYNYVGSLLIMQATIRLQ